MTCSTSHVQILGSRISFDLEVKSVPLVSFRLMNSLKCASHRLFISISFDNSLLFL